MSENKCPVDHKSRSVWAGASSSNTTPAPDASSSHQDGPESSEPSSSSHGAPPNLSTSRETSSIPRADGAKWVYPSEAQFFTAMARKQHNPQAGDMPVVVPIHNAVNERAWSEVMMWEKGRGGDACGGVKLVNFQGKPGNMSPRARFNTLLGYSPPFDRHDWVVDRCGTKIRYVIDFYTGKTNQAGNLAFYLDVRPALDNWEGVRMRIERTWDGWMSSFRSDPKTTTPQSPSNAISSS